jgi:predicted TIM-barrel fold metal-dependent hydrolase
MTLFHQTQEFSIGRHNGRFVYNPVCSDCLGGIPHRRHRKVAASETARGASASPTAAAPGIGGTSPADVSARKIIDVHHHLMPPRYYEEVGAQRIFGRSSRKASGPFTWTPQTSIDAMDRNGIATALTSISAPGTWFASELNSRTITRYCNDYAAQLMADYPGRFGMFAALPLPDIDGSLREIEYALDTLKADGFCLMSSYDNKWPGDDAFKPVFDELNRRKAVVFVHPTVSAACTNLISFVPEAVIEFPFDAVRAVVSLLYSGTLSRCSDVRFIFPHAGNAVPTLKARICRVVGNDKVLASRLPNGPLKELQKLYFDIALSARPETLAPLMELVSIKNVLFGSDFPFANRGASLEENLEGFYKYGFNDEQLRAVERGNAELLLPNLAQSGR